jgi:hypothetical protein
MEDPDHNLRKPTAKGLLGIFRQAAPDLWHGYVEGRGSRERFRRRVCMPCQ